jgi:hypothetical protein
MTGVYVLKQKSLASTNSIVMVFINIVSVLCFHSKLIAGVEIVR